MFYLDSVSLTFPPKKHGLLQEESALDLSSIDWTDTLPLWKAL